MPKPWTIIDRFTTPDNATLELRRRAEDDFLICLNGRVLMNSRAQRSEIALGCHGCRGLQHQLAPRVLIGGLGMGITLRAALDALPAAARVVAAEINPRIVDWCRGPLTGLTGGAVSDPRVTVHVGDVAELIRNCVLEGGTEGFDAIILDLYQGPHSGTDSIHDPVYGSRAIARAHAALKSGGTFAVWGETNDEDFCRRLSRGGFTVTRERVGRGGYRYVVFLAVKNDRTPPCRPARRCR